ncbi:MAG: PPC domain-containing DNA-binding protein [bacterium]
MMYRHLQTGSLLRLLAGERMPDALVEFARREGWTSGWLSGIGGVDEVVVGYFDLATREYRERKLDGRFELLSCIGNLTMVDGEPFWHIHAIVSDANYLVLGGHLIGLRIAVTGEFWLTQGMDSVRRIYDSRIGLKLLDLSSPTA